MDGTAIRTSDGKSARLSAEAIGALRGRLRGDLCFPGEAGYEEARTIWNAMIDKRPAAVVRAGGASDVIQTVRLAAQHGLLLSVRGGGGNFGVVTSFEFRLHPVGPQVTAGLIVHPFSAAQGVLREYRRLVATAPDELCCWVVMRKAPPLPFLPKEVHGTEVLVLALCHAGDEAAGEKAVAPFKAIGRPIADVVGPHPYAGWQTAFDPLLTPGARNYWKSHDFVELGDGLIDTLLDAVRRLPSPQCEVFIASLGGAVNRVPAEATAYPHRNVNFVVNVHTRWDSPSEDGACVGWARALYQASARFATGGVYVNFMPADEPERVRSGAYGPNYERLARVKAKYDPTNLFRVNQNVAPAARV